LCRFEAVSGSDCHPPGGDLVWLQAVEPPLAEGGDGVRQEPTELPERHRRDLVLREVLLHELGEREHP